MVIRGFWEALGNRSNRWLVLGGRRSFGDAALLRLPTSAPASERGYGRNRDNRELLVAGREIREAFGEEPLDEFSNTNVVLPSCLLHIVDDASMQAVRFGYDGSWIDVGTATIAGNDVLGEARLALTRNWYPSGIVVELLLIAGHG